jgi:hypothetical protein
MTFQATRWQCWGWLALYMAFGATILATLVTAAPGVESRYRPVIENFQVESADRFDNIILIRGTMEKVRDCRYVELLAYIRPERDTFWHPLAVDFGPARDTVQSRLPIPQRWGPWALILEVPTPAQVKLAVRHECHGVYMTVTQLTTFEVM